MCYDQAKKMQSFQIVVLFIVCQLGPGEHLLSPSDDYANMSKYLNTYSYFLSSNLMTPLTWYCFKLSSVSNGLHLTFYIKPVIQIIFCNILHKLAILPLWHGWYCQWGFCKTKSANATISSLLNAKQNGQRCLGLGCMLMMGKSVLDTFGS